MHQHSIVLSLGMKKGLWLFKSRYSTKVLLDPATWLIPCFPLVCLSNYFWLWLLPSRVLYPKHRATVFGRRKGHPKATWTFSFCCRCLDNVHNVHQSFEKLDLHNSDFHLPSAAAEGNTAGRICSLTLWGSVFAHRSWFAGDHMAVHPQFQQCNHLTFLWLV